MDSIDVTRAAHFLQRADPFGFSGAVLIAHSDQILHNGAYGLADRARGVANSTATAFSVGSITKQFTAACIMRLVDLGRLDLHDSIAAYLPGVPVEKRAITIHHLLTHTAGLLNYTGGDFDEGADREHMLVTALGAPLRFAPGSDYDYSNAGYSLLAATIEIVSGRPYEDFLREELLEPAGLHYTGYRGPNWSQRAVARWYSGTVDNDTPLARSYPTWNLLGNGGILSNTEDLFYWWQALKGSEMLSAAARKALFTPFLNDYAYGWRVAEIEQGRIIEHNGASSYGSSAIFRWYVDHDLLLVVMSNALYKGSFGALVLEPILDSILFGGEVALPPPLDAAEIDWPEPGPYVQVGTEDESPAQLALSREAGGLLLQSDDQQVISALLFGQDPLAASFTVRNARLTNIFQSVLEGDAAPLAAELADEERVTRYRRIFADYWDEYAELNGGMRPERARAVRTVPSFLPGMTATEVLVPGPAEDVVLHVHFRGDAWYGVSQGISAEGFSLLLQPAAGGRFVDYDLRTGRLAILDVDPDGPEIVLGEHLRAQKPA